VSTSAVTRSSRLRVPGALRGNLIPLAILILLLVGLTVLAPSFLRVQNLLNVARQASIVGVISIGMTFVILSGGIDLSVGSTLAVAGVVSASMIVAGMPTPLILLVGIAIGAATGLANGIGVAILRIQPFIMTLAAMVLFRGVALRWTGGGPIQFRTGDSLFDFLGSGGIAAIPGPVMVFALVSIAGVIVLRYLTFGRYIYAIGGSQEAARLSGVPTSRTAIGAYVISGACAGLAGVMTTARLSSGDPLGGNLAELDAITAVVVGGTSLMGGSGGAVGTIAGALLLAVLSNAMNLIGIGPFDQMMVKGLVIIGAVLFAARATRRRLVERGVPPGGLRGVTAPASADSSGGSPSTKTGERESSHTSQAQEEIRR